MDQPQSIVEIRPGRVAALFADRLAAIESESAAAEAVREALEIARRENVQLVQSLVDLGDARGAKLLQSHGFLHLTDVLYLVGSAVGRQATQSGESLRLAPFVESPAAQRALAQLIARTYEGSQDCPQLNGLRSMDDVLASYRAIGECDSGLWFIAEWENADVGCLLLAKHAALRELEIVYQGIVPEFRGRGWGLKLIRHAQQLAAELGIERLSLAVDAENRPALAVYRAAGCEVAAQHRLFLRRMEI